MHEAALDFYVWVVEVVCEKIRLKILDSQISSLIHECKRVFTLSPKYDFNSCSVIPQISAYLASIDMSFRLLRPLKMLILPSLVTPVRNANLMALSFPFMTL